MTIPSQPGQLNDDSLTVCSISLLAAILCNLLHEGLGHAATALLTGTQSGVLSTAAWSSDFDSRLVAAGGTLANLAAGLLFWSALRRTKSASPQWRYFLFISLAFNLFTGTGYFFFSGVTNFGDWALVIAGLKPHWLWRALLAATGIASYYLAVLLVGGSLVRYVAVSLGDSRRLAKLTLISYFSTVFLLFVAGLFNPIGVQLVWQSALPATAGAQSGLLWMKYYIPKASVPSRPPDGIEPNYGWIVLAAALSLVFIFVLGRGITLHR